MNESVGFVSVVVQTKDIFWHFKCCSCSLNVRAPPTGEIRHHSGKLTVRPVDSVTDESPLIS